MWQESKSRWRRVLKTLNLLEFLIKNGSERIIDETRREQFKAQRHFGSPHFSWYLPLLDITIPQNNTTAFKKCFFNPSSESPKTMIDHFLISDGFKFQGENGGNDWGVKVVDPKCPPMSTRCDLWWISLIRRMVSCWLNFCVKDLGWNNASVSYRHESNVWKSICFCVLCVNTLPEVKIRVLQSGIRCGWEQRKEGQYVGMFGTRDFYRQKPSWSCWMTMTCFDRNERRQWSFELCCLRFTLPSVSENTDKRSALVYYAQWFLDHEDCDCVEHTEDDISCIQYVVFVVLLGGSDSPREIRGHARALLGESVYFLFLEWQRWNRLKSVATAE